MHAVVLGLLLLRGQGATSATGAGESIAARRVRAVAKHSCDYRARGGGVYARKASIQRASASSSAAMTCASVRPLRAGT